MNPRNPDAATRTKDEVDVIRDVYIDLGRCGAIVCEQFEAQCKR